ncbi:NAD-dependent protein deacylase [Desemzia sp. FAM 23991]|uniref:NAD-dependent protein deacylase n=1 Tax=unclassified Desemzia TaxID=2685243 RepID=UPI003889853B
MSEQVNKAAQMIQDSKRIVAFTGAGISTESGVPDFRSAGGFLDQLSGTHYTGEEALSVPFFEQYPELFFENYRNTLDFPDAEPNFGHQFFQLLEAKGKQVTIVTQNIDNLHEAAGSSTVFSLHGNATKWKSVNTHKSVVKEEVRWDEKGIAVESKGNVVRPDIVLYGDQLDQQVLSGAIKAIQEADLLMVIGTSLNVMPAAYLLDDFRGNQSILINQTDVAGMDRFDVVVKEKSGQFLQKVWHMLTQEENT